MEEEKAREPIAVDSLVRRNSESQSVGDETESAGRGVELFKDSRTNRREQSCGCTYSRG